MIICADARRIPLADETVQCVVTSPPYWGLRKYAGEQELVWPAAPPVRQRGEGGREGCEHEWARISQAFEVYGTKNRWQHGIVGDGRPHERGDNYQRELRSSGQLAKQPPHGGTCSRCGAWRGAYGLEPTVEMYVAHTVEILREIRRVLRADGVCFWNIGDSYCSAGKGGPWDADRTRNNGKQNPAAYRFQEQPNRGESPGVALKPKDLCLIPQRVALAAQADGWWVRSDIIWAKPNPMPESVRDRPTDAYEHILMLTKSARYYWDAGAVAEKQSHGTVERFAKSNSRTVGPKAAGRDGNPTDYCARYGLLPDLKRNIRNVWTFPMQPYRGAHFATFPEELPRRCILAASKPGDVVLDPFAGSGTTGRVAIALGRVPVMLDLAYGAEYRELAERRTSEVQIEAFA